MQIVIYIYGVFLDILIFDILIFLANFIFFDLFIVLAPAIGVKLGRV